MNQIAERWEDYECIDAGNGEKLERWKDIILRRPDPLALWPIAREEGLWVHPHARYHRSAKGGGHWEYLRSFPESWSVHYGKLRFKVSPTGFKHTGLFPEQAANWDFMPTDRSACSTCSLIPEAPPWPAPLPARRKSYMSMLPRAWCNGPKRTWCSHTWKTVISASSSMMS